MKKTFILFCAIAIGATISCKKEDANSSEILLSKTWKRSLVDKNPTTNPSGGMIYSSVQNCEMDDTFNFGADGKLAINRGAVKCDQTESQSITQSFTINRASKELIIDGTTYVLAEESATQIKYYAVQPAFIGYIQIVFLLE